MKHLEVLLGLASRVIDVGINEILSRQCYSLVVYSRTEKTLVPLIFLSATIAMFHEREREAKGSFRCPHAKTIRLPSNRPNIKYSVISVSNTTLIPKQLATLILSHPMHNEADRGITYLLFNKETC